MGSLKKISQFGTTVWPANSYNQGCNARKVNCGRVYSAYILKPVLFMVEFVNKNICISVRLVSEEVKSIKFDNFDNSHNSFLWPEYFIDFSMWKMDPVSGFDIRLVFTLPPSDSTLQYKRCVHFWNNFPCIITLEKLQYFPHFCFCNYLKFRWQSL